MERDKPLEHGQSCGSEGEVREVRMKEGESECGRREGRARLDSFTDHVHGARGESNLGSTCACASSGFEASLTYGDDGKKGRCGDLHGKRSCFEGGVDDNKGGNRNEPSVENVAATADTFGTQSVAKRQRNQHRGEMKDGVATRAEGFPSTMPLGQNLHQGSTGRPGGSDGARNVVGPAISHHATVRSLPSCVGGQAGAQGHVWAHPRTMPGSVMHSTVGSRHPDGSQDSSHIPCQHPAISSPRLVVHAGTPMVGYPSTVAQPVEHAWNASAAPVPGQVIHQQNSWYGTTVPNSVAEAPPTDVGSNHFVGISHGQVQGVPATAPASRAMPSVQGNSAISVLGSGSEPTGMAPPLPPGGSHGGSSLNALGGCTSRRVPRTVFPFMPGAPWAQGLNSARHGEGSAVVATAAPHGLPRNELQWLAGAPREVHHLPNSLPLKGQLPAMHAPVLSGSQGMGSSVYQRQQQTSVPIGEPIPVNGLGMASPMVLPVREGQGGVLVQGFPAGCGNPFVGDQSQMAANRTFRSMPDDDRMDGGPGEIITTHHDYKVKEGNTKDQKKLKRMLSNRASAKRSRQRRMQRLEELESQAEELRVENASLVRKNNDATEKLSDYLQENRQLQTEIETLRQELEKRRANCKGGEVDSTGQVQPATSFSMEVTTAGSNQEDSERSLEAATSDQCDSSTGPVIQDVDDKKAQHPASGGGTIASSSCPGDDPSGFVESANRVDDSARDGS